MFTKLLLVTISLLTFFNQNAMASTCDELFIAGYHEGVSEKESGIVIYNPTDLVADLNHYSLVIYENGSPTISKTIFLNGSLGPNTIYTIANDSISEGFAKYCDLLTNLSFDGNDAIALRVENHEMPGTWINIDVVGEIGVDPGTGGWLINPSGSTVNALLTRKSSVSSGQTNWSIGMNEWNHEQNGTFLQSLTTFSNDCSCQIKNEKTWSWLVEN